MKKYFLILVVVTLLAALAVVPVLAKPSLVKGVITNITDSQITLETKKGAEVIFNLPEDFDLTTIEVGDTVIAKCQTVGIGLVADWVKKIGKGSSENEDRAEGRKDNSAWCNADKKQEAHPFAKVLAEKYGANPTWVMQNFCDGYSMGAIMLALKTHAINGANPDDILSKRADGLGWGAIWKELKMIGSEREAKTPPGQLKKP
jgi:hypothetical protein